MIGFHYYFNGFVGRETRWQTCESVSLRAEYYVRSPFLRSSRVHPTLLMASERLPHTGTVHIKRTGGVRGLACEVYMSCVSGFPLQGVHRFKLP
jgi:hypothetical protein